MRRWLSGLLVILMVLVMLPGASAAAAAGGSAYLQVRFDRGSYRPGQVAAVTVFAHQYDGLASVTAELRYNTDIFGPPTIGDDFLSGGLMEGATALAPIYAPGGVAINLSRATGVSDLTGGWDKLFTLHFPVLDTAPDTMDAYISFGPVTGLVPSGALLLDADDNVFHIVSLSYDRTAILMGGSIAGQVSLLESTSGNFSGVTVSIPEHEIEVTTNTDGAFAIYDLPPGVYDLRLYKPGYLITHVLNAVVVRGGTADLTNAGLALVPGNIRDAAGLAPDTIFLEDLAGLARSIGATSTNGNTLFGTTWNPAADLDDDGSIGASDLAILAQNWGLNGPEGSGMPTPGTVVDLGLPVQAAVTLTVSAQPSSVQVGQDVHIHATLSNSAGVSVAHKMIEFVVGGQHRLAATNVDGVATVTMKVEHASETVSFTASFWGDPTLQSANASGSFEVLGETAILSPPGMAFDDSISDQLWSGEPLTLRVSLTDGDTPINGAPITFSIADLSGVEVLNSGPINTMNGIAEWQVPTDDLEPGSFELKAFFPGNETYSAAQTEPWYFTVSIPTTPTISVYFESSPGVTTTTVAVDEFVWVIGQYDEALDDTFTFAYLGPNDTAYFSFDEEMTTDGSAAVIFDATDLEPGLYTIRVTDSKGVSGSATLTVEAADVHEPTTYAVSMYVLPSCVGVYGSVAGATVTVYGSGDIYGPLTTDEFGNVTFQLPPGDYTYDITAEGYQSSLGSPLTVTGEISLTPELVPDMCLESVKVYEGTYPFGNEVNEVWTAGRTYYLHAVFVGTPPAGDVTFWWGKDYNGDWVIDSQGEIGTVSIVDSEAHLTWNPSEQELGTVLIVVYDAVNWHQVYGVVQVVEGEQ